MASLGHLHRSECETLSENLTTAWSRPATDHPRQHTLQSEPFSLALFGFAGAIMVAQQCRKKPESKKSVKGKVSIYA